MPRRPQSISSDAPTFMDPAHMPWALVSEVYWMSWKLLERRIYQLGVSGSQARVMMVLRSSPGPIKPSAIATVLFQETQSITGILHRIEARGWVQRLPDPTDRRAVGLELTAEGRKVADSVREVSRELYDELFADALGAAEKRNAETALRKVRANGFRMPETDFRLRRAQQYPIWKD